MKLLPTDDGRRADDWMRLNEWLLHLTGSSPQRRRSFAADGSTIASTGAATARRRSVVHAAPANVARHSRDEYGTSTPPVRIVRRASPCPRRSHRTRIRAGPTGGRSGRAGRLERSGRVDPVGRYRQSTGAVPRVEWLQARVDWCGTVGRPLASRQSTDAVPSLAGAALPLGRSGTAAPSVTRRQTIAAVPAIDWFFTDSRLVRRSQSYGAGPPLDRYRALARLVRHR